MSIENQKKQLNFLLEKEKKIAFEAIFRSYYDKLFHFSIYYLSSSEDAEEITQDVFLKLWKNMGKLKEINNLNNYLLTMTKNACLNYLKHKKIAANFIEERKLLIQGQFINDDAASLLLENELKKKIFEGIDKLPEKCREIFIKSRFEGLKNKEIAHYYSISKKTVDNQISKGLTFLRFHLREFTSLFLIFFL